MERLNINLDMGSLTKLRARAAKNQQTLTAQVRSYIFIGELLYGHLEAGKELVVRDSATKTEVTLVFVGVA